MPCPRRLAALPALAAALAVAGGAGGAAALTPDRTIVATLPVRDLAMTGRSVAYVADAPDRLQCASIGYWSTVTRRRILFDSKEQCLELSSTGQGVWDLAIAEKRLLWITYTGGNLREWFLWTATTTRRTPRRLRFVTRHVEDPPPVVIGPGTAEGIPYAVERQIVYLGDDGRAIFRAVVESPVRAIAAGHGGRLRVAALLADGRVVGFDEAGEEYTSETFPPKAVVSVRVSGLGTAVQVEDVVEIVPPRAHDGVTVTLPAGSRMVDVAQGRILWWRTGDVGTTAIATGRSVRLVAGTPSEPALGQLEQRGLAWARGRIVRWRAGVLP
jgi:hypothetical protein